MSEDQEPEKTYETRVTISSLGNERRTIHLGQLTDSQVQETMQKVDMAFRVIRDSNALVLAGSDGQLVFAHLDNIAFIEVRID